MSMTRSQYDELREQLKHGRRVVYIEGRSAATVAELDWIATEVYGLKLGGPAPKAESVKQPEQRKQPEEPKKATTPPKEPSGKEDGDKPANVNLARANLETLRKVATENGIEFPADATRGQLLDLISKSGKGE